MLVDPDTIRAVLERGLMRQGRQAEAGEVLEMVGAEYGAVRSTLDGITLRSQNPRAPAVVGALDIIGNGVVIDRVKVQTKQGELRAVMLARGKGQVLRHVEVTAHNGRGISIDGTSVKPLVEYCWIHGQKYSKEALAGNIGIGGSKATMYTPIGAVIRYNLLEDNDVFQGIEMKSSENEIYRNTVLGSDIFVRHGQKNRIYENIVRNGVIGLSHDENWAWSNIVEGTTASGPACVAIRAGTAYAPGRGREAGEPSESDDLSALDSDEDGEGPEERAAAVAGAYYGARNSRTAHNKGRTINGWKRAGRNWPLGTKGTSVEGGDKVEDLPGSERARLRADSDLKRVTAVEVKRGMVGVSGAGEPGPVDPPVEPPVDPPLPPLPQPPVNPPVNPPVDPQPTDAAKIAAAIDKLVQAAGDMDDKIKAIAKTQAKKRQKAEDVALAEVRTHLDALRNLAKGLRGG